MVMTDGTAWLAEPQSMAYGGYSVVIAPDLESESLARRIAETAPGRYRPRPIGELTGRQVQDLLEGLYGEVREGIALRHVRARRVVLRHQVRRLAGQVRLRRPTRRPGRAARL